MQKLSVIIPICNEETNIGLLYSKIKDVLIRHSLFYEIIFVDDGSKDRSFEVIKELGKKESHIIIIRLSKNYGQSLAYVVGFIYAIGDIIITIDGDLENDPQDIPRFIERINEGFDFVSGWRKSRKISFLRKLNYKMANWLMYIKTGIKLHDWGCGFNAVKRQTVSSLIPYGKKQYFIKSLIACLAGSRIAELEIRYYPRKHGVSKYNFFKIIKYGFNFLINFNAKSKETAYLEISVAEAIVCR